MITTAHPDDSTFTLITQNVDGLSTRALHDVAAKKGADLSQAAPYYEMHGRILDTICTATCERREHNSANEPLCPALAAAGALPADPHSLAIEGDVRPESHGLGAALRSGVIGGVIFRQLLRWARVRIVTGSSDMVVSVSRSRSRSGAGSGCSCASPERACAADGPREGAQRDAEGREGATGRSVTGWL